MSLDVLLTEYPDAAEQILHSWYGPERLQHDFIFKDLAVEIKSISSIDKRSVKISLAASARNQSFWAIFACSGDYGSAWKCTW